ncbi:MAG TPA: glycosyltransferase [Phycisphaerales bacterium]|nr:glycosyltransferase [Phycisphaerales bacterium]
MHVLMLGWEFPPFITGGLGTACFGLTKALDRQDIEVTFVLPKAIVGEHTAHVNLVSPQTIGPSGGGTSVTWTTIPSSTRAGSVSKSVEDIPYQQVHMLNMPEGIASPYGGGAPGPEGEWRMTIEGKWVREKTRIKPGQTSGGITVRQESQQAPAVGPDYGWDLMGQVENYARFVAAATRHIKFDVIHAHDWLTYPAGLAIASLTGKPWVVHVHSTEFDRSGEHVNQRIYDIERRGMHAATRVVTVSLLTKNIVERRYGVPGAKVQVVYNGIDFEPTQRDKVGIQSKDKIVLYFGRITYQKGPEYFIQAARRVLEYMDNVKFVVAGSGDQAAGMIEMAAKMGIGHKVLFTGFLRGRDIQRVFSLADLYVMPSVSEPFGIAPLEAMAADVPALISKSSGVSEVLSHALKVDFWDIEDMANKIIAVLRHPPLSRTLREHGAFEVRSITWDGAASRCRQVYQSAIDEMKHSHSARA